MARKKPRTEPPPRWSEPLLAPPSQSEIPGTGDASRGAALPVDRADAEAMRVAPPKPTTSTTPRRFHLAVVRELHTGAGSAESAGASVNYTREPAWIQFEPDGTAVVAVAGGCPVARWDVRESTNDVAALNFSSPRDDRRGDAEMKDVRTESFPETPSLLVSIREEYTREGHEARNTQGTVSDKKSRALVLGFHRVKDARDALIALSVKEKNQNQHASRRKLAEAFDGLRRRVSDVSTDDDSDVFTKKIDRTSAESYFSYYASLAEQQNMLQDRVRTGTYFTAILEHRAAFFGKIVMDVGAGSGVLSCFAALAGARRVYAVEASDMADHCATLVANDARLRDVVKVIKGRVESDAVRRAVLEDLKGIHGGAEGSSIVDSRNVDVLVSEPMGTMLFNERMIESFLIARDRFLKPKGGQMFPRAARLHCAPFEDFTLRAEILDKATFWCSDESKDFYGIDVSVLGPEATKTYFAQPVVDAFDPTMLLADPATFEFDFLGDEVNKNGETKRRLNAEHLERLFLRADFVSKRDGVAHGLAWWFDVEFDVRNPIGSCSTRNGQNRRFLTTAPGAPTTHWFQIRLPFRDAMKINRNARVETETEMIASANQSYAVTAVLARGDSDGNNKNVSTKEQAVSGTWNLKDPYYRQLHYPQPGYTEAQTKRWYGDEAAEVRGADARFFADAERSK